MSPLHPTPDGSVKNTKGSMAILTPILIRSIACRSEGCDRADRRLPADRLERVVVHHRGWNHGLDRCSRRGCLSCCKSCRSCLSCAGAGHLLVCITARASTVSVLAATVLPCWPAATWSCAHDYLLLLLLCGNRRSRMLDWSGGVGRRRLLFRCRRSNDVEEEFRYSFDVGTKRLGSRRLLFTALPVAFE